MTSKDNIHNNKTNVLPVNEVEPPLKATRFERAHSHFKYSSVRVRVSVAISHCEVRPRVYVLLRECTRERTDSVQMAR